MVVRTTKWINHARFRIRTHATAAAGMIVIREWQVIRVLEAMGARVRLENVREGAWEPTADIVAETSDLRGTEIGGEIVPQVIDELPILALAPFNLQGGGVIIWPSRPTGGGDWPETTISGWGRRLASPPTYTSHRGPLLR